MQLQIAPGGGRRRKPLLPRLGKGNYSTYAKDVRRTLKPGQSLAYAPGRGYYPKGVARPPVVRPARPAVVRPAAPVAPAMNPLMTQANSAVQSIFSPLIQQLAKEKMAMENAMRAQYQAHGGAIEGALQRTAAPIAGSFDTAIAQSAKVNEAVANRLGNVGASASGDLATQLAQIGADPSNAAALAQTYTGASNAGFASGAADLSHLIGRRGEALSYTGKLPGIARIEANRDYQNALNQARGEFSERERGLQEEAVGASWEHYNQLRQEGIEARQARQEAKQASEDRRAQERMALAALAQTAVTKQQEQAIKQQQIRQERQWDLEDAAMERQWEIEDQNFEVQTREPKAPPKMTGPSSQRYISVNGKIVSNPNYVAPSKAKAGGKGAKESWTTPGSAKRNRVIQRASSTVMAFGPDGGLRFAPEVLQRLRRYPMSADAIINTAINTAIRAEVGGNINSPSAKAIRSRIRQQLSGKAWTAADGRNYTFRA